MKIRSGVVLPWTYNRRTSKMFRSTEWKIWLGSGLDCDDIVSGQTVGDLKDLLKELPEEASVSADESSGQGALYIALDEEREPTDVEKIQEMKLETEEIRSAVQRESARTHARLILRQPALRRNVSGDLKVLDGVISHLQSVINSSGDPEALVDFRTELKDLNAEKIRLQNLLSIL